MSYPAAQVANTFLDIAKEAGRSLTNMQVQKLVYFAHGWYLALRGEPLIAEPVKAWTFGPVIPPLYNRLRQFGNGYVNESLPGGSLPDGYEARLARRIWQMYGHMTGPQMSFLTHKAGTPWDLTWQENKFGEIPSDLIQEHFESLKVPANANR